MSSLSGDGGRSCSRRGITTGPDVFPEQGTLDAKLRMRSKFCTTCQRFGMSECALDAWEKLHDPVEPAVFLFFAQAWASAALYVYLLTGAPADGMNMYLFRVPLIVCLGAHVFHTCGIWCHGQPFYVSNFSSVGLAETPCLLCVMIAGYLCRLESVPFASTIQFTSVLATLIWLIYLRLAIIPMTLPAEPATNLVCLPLQALLGTLRSVDACTDLSFIRVLAAQVCHHCTRLPPCSILKFRQNNFI